MHHILNEDKDSLKFKFLQTQLRKKSPKDWITQVFKDIMDLKLNLSLALNACSPRFSFPKEYWQHSLSKKNC